MAVSIVLGVIIGFLGFLPLFVGLKLVRRATNTSNLSQAGAALLGVLGSFLVLAAGLIVCILIARDLVLPFTLAVVAGLLVSTIGYGVYTLVRK